MHSIRLRRLFLIDVFYFWYRKIFLIFYVIKTSSKSRLFLILRAHTLIRSYNFWCHIHTYPYMRVGNYNKSQVYWMNLFVLEISVRTSSICSTAVKYIECILFVLEISVRTSSICSTAWKKSKYGVFLGPYFPFFATEKIPISTLFTQCNEQNLFRSI